MSALHHYPPNVGEEAVALSAAEFDAYWPHVNNIWATPSTIRVEAAMEILNSPPLLHPDGRRRGPDVVDVWPIRVEFGGGEGDGLLKAE
ncbi:MAG: hypothetical protein FRX48_02344 [Lasallia pustulata]|uniref:Uncharacterized protein n=1 Tax=Lasallia pustulata TaxID=136370 RepID=A0A5M8PYF0_9LECA|nr:MAG: hypothetical protein FRX48_02344 [Lasallia pustulata]